jgi:hypothetical protein
MAVAQIKNVPAIKKPVCLKIKINVIKIHKIYNGIFKSELIEISFLIPDKNIIIPNRTVKIDIQNGKNPEEIFAREPIL